jgi:hypothetical protein
VKAVKKHFVDALTPEQLEALDRILRALRAHLRSEPTLTRTEDDRQ